MQMIWQLNKFKFLEGCNCCVLFGSDSFVAGSFYCFLCSVLVLLMYVFVSFLCLTIILLRNSVLVS